MEQKLNNIIKTLEGEKENQEVNEKGNLAEKRKNKNVKRDGKKSNDA